MEGQVFIEFRSNSRVEFQFKGRTAMKKQEHCLSKWLVPAAIIMLWASGVLSAQEKFDIKAHYNKAEYMIPMRDGVKIYTQVYSPKDQSKKYPFMLSKTPYASSRPSPEPLVPNQVTKLEYDLLDKAHTFLKNHKIMVQVQSTWFPLIDRNPRSLSIFTRRWNRTFRRPRTKYIDPLNILPTSSSRFYDRRGYKNIP